MLNLTHYRNYQNAEEAIIFGLIELDESEPPISEDEAFNWINGRVFTTTWPDDEFPW